MTRERERDDRHPDRDGVIARRSRTRSREASSDPITPSSSRQNAVIVSVLIALALQVAFLGALLAINRVTMEPIRETLSPVVRWHEREEPAPRPTEPEEPLPLEAAPQRVEDAPPELELEAPMIEPLDLPPLPATAVDVRVPVRVDLDPRPPVSRTPIRAEATGGVYAVGEVDRGPRARPGNRKPDYSLIARRRGWEGTVTLELWIDTDGSVYRVDVLETSGRDVFQDAAVEAARVWRFEPAERGGRPVRCRMRQVIHFSLEER
ncbi:MAG TPA: energy transducer TonB [Planctomycetota bacterium]|nr:energy transducer TonB [Planctomycetota bacterium]